jgi:hypothetical protein
MPIFDIASFESQRSYRNFNRKLDLLSAIRDWLDRFPINDIQTAETICRLIPASCPFERDMKLFGRTLFHMPALCRINPLYEDLVSLRFRAEIFLTADRN